MCSYLNRSPRPAEMRTFNPGIGVVEQPLHFLVADGDHPLKFVITREPESLLGLVEPAVGMIFVDQEVKLGPGPRTCHGHRDAGGRLFHEGTDGGRKLSDHWRDHQLKSLGWRVRRFWVDELAKDMEACLDLIERDLAYRRIRSQTFGAPDAGGSRNPTRSLGCSVVGPCAWGKILRNCTRRSSGHKRRASGTLARGGGDCPSRTRLAGMAIRAERSGMPRKHG